VLVTAANRRGNPKEKRNTRDTEWGGYSCGILRFKPHGGGERQGQAVVKEKGKQVFLGKAVQRGPKSSKKRVPKKRKAGKELKAARGRRLFLLDD